VGDRRKKRMWLCVCVYVYLYLRFKARSTLFFFSKFVLYNGGREKFFVIKSPIPGNNKL